MRRIFVFPASVCSVNKAVDLLGFSANAYYGDDVFVTNVVVICFGDASAFH